MSEPDPPEPQKQPQKQPEPPDPDAAVAEFTAELDIARLVERAEAMLLGGPSRYTRAQVAELAGLDLDRTIKLWRALGFARVADDDVAFGDMDVQSLSRVESLRDAGIADEELVLAWTRVLGQTFSRLASGQGQLILEMLAARPDLLESEESVLALFEYLVPTMEQLQSYVWRRQFVAYFNRVALQAAGDRRVSTIVGMAVGFADMAGFTTLTRQATEAELRELLDAFETAASEAVAAQRGRIVKTIGDEVLFVADTPEQAAEIALTLLATAEQDERLPPLRIGLAAGEVVTRLGDVYGSTVNIASRLTGLCRPGWVLVDREMARALRDGEGYALKARRPEAVRGFAHLQQWRLRRSDDVRSRRGHEARDPARVRGNAQRRR